MCLHIGEQFSQAPSGYTLDTIKFLRKKGINIVIANHEYVVHGSKWDIKDNYFATY